MIKVSVVGFGHIGSVIGGVLAENGLSVTGVDKNHALIEAFSAGREPIGEPGLQALISKTLASGALTLTGDASAIAESDAVIITVGTPLGGDNRADVTQLAAACEELAPHIQDGQLIMVKSTVPPGTTRDMVHAILGRNAKIDVVFSPERLAEGNAIAELKSLPIVIGGVTEGAASRAAEFWSSVLGVDTITVATAESAELVKLADNAWIDLNIALAHDLAKLCDALPYSIDVIEVIRAANTLKKGPGYVNILTPSNGVGGYCLTKDPWFVHTLGADHGLDLRTLEAGRRTNEEMPSYAAERILSFLSERGISTSKAKVAVLGLAFKTDSGDVRFTPVLPFLEKLKTAGVGTISVFDPMVTSHDSAKIGVPLSASLDDALRGADCVAIMAAHSEIKAIDAGGFARLCNHGALVFDGRRYFSREEISAIGREGLTYRGIGR